jgi:metal-responsive CopG/Arc/MetJ family transcriptional regulator
MVELEKETLCTTMTTIKANQMRDIIHEKGYMNESDFIRRAIEEKIDRERKI